jgi:hypothetical protein
MTPSTEDLYRDLTELIEAIDRRLPRLANINEPAIADDAAALRDQAVQVLAKLEEARAKLKTS